ncbi:hypothetical protein ES702_04090 [subsurface metagenome]
MDLQETIDKMMESHRPYGICTHFSHALLKKARAYSRSRNKKLKEYGRELESKALLLLI